MKQEELAFVLAAGDAVRDDLGLTKRCLALYFDARKPVVTIEDVKSEAAFFEVLRLNKVARFADLSLSRRARLDRKYGLGASLEHYHRRTVVNNSAAMSASLAAATALKGASIPSLAMKGPIQQKRLYGDAFVKPSGDVDLLVNASDFAEARDVLCGTGYAVANESRSGWWVKFLGEQHLVATTGSARIKLDLHYRLQQPGSPSPTDFAGFVARRESYSVMGKSIDVMSQHDVVLLAAMSVAKALFNREPCAGYVCDIFAGLRSTVDQGALLAHARLVGLEHTLLLGVRAASVLIEPLEGVLFEAAGSALRRVSEETLELMILAPWLASLRWPRRREMLWDLCGAQPKRYAAETAWLLAAEAGRRLLERPEHR